MLWCTSKGQTSVKTEPLPLDSRGYRVVIYEFVLDPPEKLHAHSSQGVSSSWALLKGVSVEEIYKAASWSSRHTFIRFYMLDVAEPSFLHGVLQAGDL